MLRVPLEALSLLVGPAADLRVALPARALHERHRVPDAQAPPNIACAGAVAASQCERWAAQESRVEDITGGICELLPRRQDGRRQQAAIVLLPAKRRRGWDEQALRERLPMSGPARRSEPVLHVHFGGPPRNVVRAHTVQLQQGSSFS